MEASGVRRRCTDYLGYGPLRIRNSGQRRFSALVVTCFLCLSFGLLCRSAPAPSTRRMAERLQKLARECDPLATPFLNREAAEIFRTQLHNALERPTTA